MADESLQLVLTPQAFHNIQPDADLFNNINAQFWVREKWYHSVWEPCIVRGPWGAMRELFSQFVL